MILSDRLYWRKAASRAAARKRVRQLKAGGATEFTSPIPFQVSRLAGRRNLVSLPGPAHHVGRLGHLLFELAVGRAASGAGGCLCGVRDLGSLAITPAAYVSRRGRAVSRRRR